MGRGTVAPPLALYPSQRLQLEAPHGTFEGSICASAVASTFRSQLSCSFILDATILQPYNMTALLLSEKSARGSVQGPCVSVQGPHFCAGPCTPIFYNLLYLNNIWFYCAHGPLNFWGPCTYFNRPCTLLPGPCTPFEHLHSQPGVNMSKHIPRFELIR